MGFSDEHTNTSRDLTCPSCRSRAWELCDVSGKYGDPRVIEFYRCRNPECRGAFRVNLWNGRRTEVAALWSKITDRRGQTEPQGRESAGL